MSENGDTQLPWKTFHDSFWLIAGEEPWHAPLIQSNISNFTCGSIVYMKATNEIIVMGTQPADKETGNRKVYITKITIGQNSEPTTWTVATCDNIPLANGAVSYEQNILFCAHGTMLEPSGLFLMEASPPHKVRPFMVSFLDRPFNSPSRVAVQRDGSIWFTDSSYGYEHGYRLPPDLPNRIYCYRLSRRSIRAVADGLDYPDAICFSPDEKIVYVTDVARAHGNKPELTDPYPASSIYAFDVTYYDHEPFLTNRRLFAMNNAGDGAGIKCDMFGNVYGGGGAGVSIWSPGGVLMGGIPIPGGVTDLCFGYENDLFMVSGASVWRARLGTGVKGVPEGW